MNDYGAISYPIYQTATYAHPGVGQSTGYDYNRVSNPTRDQLEKTVASLEGGSDALAFSSGMAAITLLMELFKPGDHIIADSDLYGGSIRLFKEINETYGSKQIVFEMKNVAHLEREHINQLNRYLSNTFGKFGVIVTRNEPSKPMQQNIIDLWSGQRVCILVLTDYDMQQMVQIYEDKQRFPYEYLKMVYVKQVRKYPV